jgi:NYN domain
VDRCALFVDAGYALADGAMAVHGTRRRDSVSWDHAGLLKLLAGLARDRTGLPVLRCYWYETADGGRTAEHDALAEMPGLKLRLVNTRPGRREGIESQLRRDIVTLAKSGAIADAFIASSDEHLAEIVAEVQDLGLRVVVLHIASDGGWTIPQPLRQECDDIVEISAVHLRPFVDLIRGAEPAAEEHYAGGYGSRSRADSDGSVAAAPAQSGVPAQAQSAPAGAYQASGGPDNGPAQPYANSGRSSAPEQALMAVRGAESDAGAGQFGTSQFGGLTQEGAARQVIAEPAPAAQAHHAGQHALSEQAQQAMRGPGQDMADGAATHYGQHAGGQHASQSAAPQRAAQGRAAQHPAHAALEALEAGAYPVGGTGPIQPAGHSQPGSAQPGSAQPPGVAQQVGPAGVVPVGTGPGAEPMGGRDYTGRGTGYPDSAPSGTHGHSGSYQSGGYQNGGYQSGEFMSGGFQGAGFPAAPPQTSPGHSGPGQSDSGQSGPGQGGPGQGGPGQTSTVHHLSGLSFPAGTVGSSQNGVSTGPSSNGAAQAGGQQGSYPNGSGQNGTGLQPVPGYQNGSAQNAPGQYGSFGGYQPGNSNNGNQVNPDFTGGGSRYPADNAVPAGGNGTGGGRANVNPAGFDAAPGAGQPSPYGASDPGYFPGQAAGGQQGPYSASQPGQGVRSRDAYAPVRNSYGHAQAAEPSFQPHAAGQAPPYQAQPHLPAQGSQPPAPVPAVRASQPVAISLPEAVRAAHSEGFTFGESVGRDAPGLWLEAVLARKPRMPSDLEARLLQGSVLPIDSLLHDEVRHSLRRGFWEALESARR